MQRRRFLASAASALTALHLPDSQAKDSRCYGRVAHGHIDDAIALPDTGPNFSVYHPLGSLLGRNYVHTIVARVMLATYAQLAQTLPDVHFVYGETGWRSGGRLRPHRTHQNGLSVDFFVPVRDQDGHSVPLPAGIFNRLGYGINFDQGARHGELKIDFAAMSEHLYTLRQQAQKAGIDLALVIFEPSYLERLFATPHGNSLRETLPLMKGKAWIRHDQHYHVDFAVPCDYEAD